MAKLRDVAEFFIALGQDMAEAERGDVMTNLRLQQMLYYAQGWMLMRSGNPLYSESIEAWQFGPVVPECYEWYSGCKSNPLSAEMPAKDQFTSEEYELLLDTWTELSQYSTSQLVSMTQEKGTPWYEVWYNTKQREIEKEAIKEYFDRSRLPDTKDKLSSIQAVKPLYRENGIPVFSSKEVSANRHARCDTEYLESLPDEVFFAHRYKMSEEDEALLLKNSCLINGRRFYKARIKEQLAEKYAALTNPKDGEPGSKSNPLVRFGKEYVYSVNGDLVLYRRDVNIEQVRKGW